MTACNEPDINVPYFYCRALSVVLYLAFLFVVVIILLNVLIAQMTDTYSRASAMAEAVFLRSQCWYLAKLQDQRHAACLPYYFYRLFRHLAIQLCVSYLPV